MSTSLTVFNSSSGIARYIKGILHFEIQIASHDYKAQKWKTFAEIINQCAIILHTLVTQMRTLITLKLLTEKKNPQHFYVGNYI